MRHRTRLRYVLEAIEAVVVLGSVVCTWPVSRRWLSQWGSRPGERALIWPGDRLVAARHTAYTRAINIHAPSDAVWRWVVQFGLGRAGFYSYEFLERIVGIPVINVESIEPSLQTLAVGDEIRLHPKAPPIPVADLLPGLRICFGEQRVPRSTDATSHPARSWSMYIVPTAATACRLLVRGCIEPPCEAAVMKRLGAALEAPVDFVMEQRMLRTIRRLAEAGETDPRAAH